MLFLSKNLVISPKKLEEVFNTIIIFLICIKPFTSFIIRVQINHLCKIKFILFESVLHFCYHFFLHVLYFSHDFSFKIQPKSFL